jgi:hypothetical protein
MKYGRLFPPMLVTVSRGVPTWVSGGEAEEALSTTILLSLSMDTTRKPGTGSTEAIPEVALLPGTGVSVTPGGAPSVPAGHAVHVAVIAPPVLNEPRGHNPLHAGDMRPANWKITFSSALLLRAVSSEAV